MLKQNITWSYAIDIHGIGQHHNFGAIMLHAGAMTPQEMQRSIRLAETLKDRMNNDPHFNGWRTLFGAAEQALDAPCPDPSFCPVQGSALAGAGSTEFAEYYTVIDAIGYTDS